MESHRQESFVDSGLLSALSTRLDAPMKCDILYSLLAARLMAAGSPAGRSDFAHDTFVQALKRCGWTLRREQLLQPAFEHLPGVTLKDLINRGMADVALDDQRELACEALAELARLALDSPARLLYQQGLISESLVGLAQGEERRTRVRLRFAVSTRSACIEVLYLAFETTQSAQAHWLTQAFAPSCFTSAVTVQLHSFELAARAFASSREQLVAFVGTHGLTAVGPVPALSGKHRDCAAVRAPDSPSLR
ncbi:hypothetical protein ABVN20_16805 [Pseudomonas sp. MYb118]